MIGRGRFLVGRCRFMVGRSWFLIGHSRFLIGWGRGTIGRGRFFVGNSWGTVGVYSRRSVGVSRFFIFLVEKEVGENGSLQEGDLAQK